MPDLHLENEYNSFLQSDCKGKCWFIMPTAMEAVSVIEHYLRCKKQDPQGTTAVILLPHLSNTAWQMHTKHMTCLQTFPKASNILSNEEDSDSKLPCPYAMYYDAPSVKTGQYGAAALCSGVQSIAEQPTFVFTGKVAGLNATVLWDPGAVRSYVDKSYAERNHLHIQPTQAQVVLANGQLAQVMGVVQVPITIQQYKGTVLFYVMDLAPGIDFILGDDWSKNNTVIADYAREGVEPSLLVRKGKTRRLYPDRCRAIMPELPELSASIISASQAFSLLTTQSRVGGKQSFLVMVREVSPTADADPTNSRLQSLLGRYEIVFESPTIGEYRSFTPRCIETVEGVSPPNARPFRLSQSERDEVERQVKDLLLKGFIEPSSSPYGAPVLFVPKPDGSLRMCIDYRALNAISVRNKYPLPRIDDLLDSLSGAQYFSALDLTQGYHQLVLHSDDVPKTAFNTHIGKYQFKVLPFGLTNAPSVFQSAMNTLFSDMLNKGVLIYLDDILVYSKTEEEHYQLLERVLQRLKDVNLKARQHKCHFFKSELKYLGHIVSRNGLKPDSTKVQAISEWPMPNTVYDVRSFLGLTNYFRKFIQGYAVLARPLTDLLKGLDKSEQKGKSRRYDSSSHKTLGVRWSQECEQSFIQLKAALTSAPVLVLPDFNKPFELVCDAASVHPPGIGAVLLQQGHPVAFYSRKLSKAEENYTIQELEMLAVICALKEFRCYLHGAEFTIVTDHEPNVYLDTMQLNRRRARWLETTACFNYRWVYRPGRLNVADPLSRVPHQPSYATAVSPVAPTGAATWACGIFTVLTSRSSRSSSSAGRKRHRNSEDSVTEDASEVARYANSNFLERVKAGYEQDSWFVAENTVSFIYEAGLWWTKRHQLVVPRVASLRTECIESMHDHPFSGHFGQRKTLDLVQRVFYWPNMKEDVVQYCRSCPSCQLNKASSAKPAGLLQPLPIPGRRWESISMDFIVELPVSKSGNDTILVIVDRLTKMTHIVPCKSTITAPEVAELFIKEVVRLHGWPSSIVSDRDKLFVSDFWRHLQTAFGAKLQMSSAYHPQTDGQTERMNKTLEDTLRHYIGPFQDNWEQLLPMAEFSINNAISDASGATAFLLNYGQHPDTPTVVALRQVHPDVNRFVGRWSALLQHAKACLQAAQSRQKLWADKKRRDESYQVGDLVLLSVKHFRLPKGHTPKLSPRFVGPFKICKVISNTAYALELPEHIRMHNVFHVSALRRWIEGGSYQPPPPPEIIDGELEYNVDWIELTRYEGRRRQYFVHWLGYGPEHSTWEPLGNLVNCPDKITEFWSKRGEPCPHKL